jgi:hypothetical protein
VALKLQAFGLNAGGLINGGSLIGIFKAKVYTIFLPGFF